MGSSEESSENSLRVKFDYIKSNYFRMVHADGAVGGLTPRGLLHIAFYSERSPIPQRTEHLLTPEGSGQEDLFARVQRDAIVRELEVDVMLDFNAAVALNGWLEQVIKSAKINQPVVSAAGGDEAHVDGV